MLDTHTQHFVRCNTKRPKKFLFLVLSFSAWRAVKASVECLLWPLNFVGFGLLGFWFLHFFVIDFRARARKFFFGFYSQRLGKLIDPWRYCFCSWIQFAQHMTDGVVYATRAPAHVITFFLFSRIIFTIPFGQGRRLTFTLGVNFLVWKSIFWILFFFLAFPARPPWNEICLFFARADTPELWFNFSLYITYCTCCCRPANKRETDSDAAVVCCQLFLPFSPMLFCTSSSSSFFSKFSLVLPVVIVCGRLRVGDDHLFSLIFFTPAPVISPFKVLFRRLDIKLLAGRLIGCDAWWLRPYTGMPHTHSFVSSALFKHFLLSSSSSSFPNIKCEMDGETIWWRKVQRKENKKSRHNVVTFWFDFYTGAGSLAPTGTAEDTPADGWVGGDASGFFGVEAPLVWIWKRVWTAAKLEHTHTHRSFLPMFGYIKGAQQQQQHTCFVCVFGPERLV